MDVASMSRVRRQMGDRKSKSAQVLSRMSWSERRQMTKLNAQEWHDFPGLSGTHLSWRRGAGAGWELVSSENQVWAIRDKRSLAALGQRYEIRSIWEGGKKSWISSGWVRQELVDSSGSVVMSWIGLHFHFSATTVLTMDGTEFEFPIQGTNINTVMSAHVAGGSDQPLARFRLLSPPWFAKDPVEGLMPSEAVEVAVSPGAIAMPQVVLIVALASSWIRSYFAHGGG